MVNMRGSYNVTPSEATPNRRLCMSESDQVMSWTHHPTIYVYKGNHNQNQNVVKSMRESLSKILVHYYPLAGRLRRMAGGRHELECNAKGVLLVEAESTKSLVEYGDFSPNWPIKELYPIVDYTQPIDEIPLLLVQITKFHGGEEGLAIGIALSHPVADGVSAISFINSWAKVCRGEALDQHEMFPFLDRTILKSPPNNKAPRFDHPEFKPMPLLLGSCDTSSEKKKETCVAGLVLTLEQVDKLKKKANDDKEGSSPTRPYSRYEAIAAHIWRCVTMARQLDAQQQSVVRTVVDIRRRIKPALPGNYFGNAVLPTFTRKCYVGEIISNPISYTAGMLREAVDLLTDEYIRSQLDFLRDQEDMNFIRAPDDVKNSSKDAPFYGNPNLFIVSWTSMPAYEGDFGWGKPTYFGRGFVEPDGKVYIVQSPNGDDGSILVLICLQLQHMQVFNQLFYQNI